jgi:hypothetical protein
MLRSNLRRRAAFREPLPRILIVCEGTRTEPGYFQQKRHLDRSVIELDLRPGGTPRVLVQRAAELKREAERKARSRRDVNLRFDEVWCVFDIDEHPFIPEALQQAADNQIRVAVSNPCFELWVLLHFREQRAFIDRGSVQRACREYLRDYEKRLPCDLLQPFYGDAVRRALELERWQLTRQSAGANPTTNVYMLTERIKELGRRRE